MSWFRHKKKIISQEEMRHYAVKSALKSAERNSKRLGGCLIAAGDYQHAVLRLLSIAVVEHDQLGGIAYLREEVPPILRKTADSQDVYFEQIRLAAADIHGFG